MAAAQASSKKKEVIQESYVLVDSSGMKTILSLQTDQ